MMVEFKSCRFSPQYKLKTKTRNFADPVKILCGLLEFSDLRLSPSTFRDIVYGQLISQQTPPGLSDFGREKRIERRDS